MIKKVMILSNVALSNNSIGILILTNILIVSLLVVFAGWKLLFKRDSFKKWEKETNYLLVFGGILILIILVKFYFDFPEFFN